MAARGSTRTALIAGATGLVGGECLARLITTARYERVLVLTRRDLGPELRASPKIERVLCDFAHLDAVADRLRADDVFCALGTTIRKAGSQARFREVDFQYPRQLAEITRRHGARHFSLVSAAGASRTSPFFYSRVKGELEDALRALQWPSLALLRPSVIAGERAEPRPLERVAEKVLRFAPSAWRPVPAREIATAMIVTALHAAPGVRVIESAEIPRVAAGA
jgi:uncharacterized protein YbjT (DUF2867 family)